MYNGDLPAAQFLLGAGADSSGTGVEDGNSAPFYGFAINNTDRWRHASPLHVLRKAECALPRLVNKMMQFLMDKQEEDRDSIEELLKSYGARDFVLISQGQVGNSTASQTVQGNKDLKRVVP